MKELIFIFSFAIFTLSYSQNHQEALAISGGIPPSGNLAGLSNSELSTITGNNGDFSKIVGVFYEFDDIRFAKIGTDGTFLLFDDWNNNGHIIVGDRKYGISNANYHIEREELMTKLDNDSLFLFDLNTLDEFSINTRKLKRYKDSQTGASKVYEVIYDLPEKITLLKKHSAEMQEASPNPMLNRSRNKIIHRESYYIYVNGKLSQFNLRKSEYLTLVENKEQKDLHKSVKELNLSYNKEDDAGKILDLIITSEISPEQKTRILKSVEN